MLRIALIITILLANSGLVRGQTSFSKGYSASQEVIEGFSLDFDDPINILEKEIAQKPNEQHLRFVLGILYFQSGIAKFDTKSNKFESDSMMLDKAEKQFKLVLQSKTNLSLAYYYLGLIAIQKDFDVNKAEEYFNAAITSDNKNRKAYIKLYTVYLFNKKITDSINVMERANKIFTNDADILHKLSVSYLINKQYDKTIDNAAHALSIQKNTDTQIVLASAYSLTQRYDKAVKELQDILSTDHSNRTALLGLSTVFMKTRNMEKAAEVLNKALQYYPNDVEIINKIEEVKANR